MKKLSKLFALTTFLIVGVSACGKKSKSVTLSLDQVQSGVYSNIGSEKDLETKKSILYIHVKKSAPGTEFNVLHIKNGIFNQESIKVENGQKAALVNGLEGSLSALSSKKILSTQKLSHLTLIKRNPGNIYLLLAKQAEKIKGEELSNFIKNTFAFRKAHKPSVSGNRYLEEIDSIFKKLEIKIQLTNIVQSFLDAIKAQDIQLSKAETAEITRLLKTEQTKRQLWLNKNIKNFFKAEAVRLAEIMNLNKFELANDWLESSRNILAKKYYSEHYSFETLELFEDLVIVKTESIKKILSAINNEVNQMPSQSLIGAYVNTNFEDRFRLQLDKLSKELNLTFTDGDNIDRKIKLLLNVTSIDSDKIANKIQKTFFGKPFSVFIKSDVARNSKKLAYQLTLVHELKHYLDQRTEPKLFKTKQRDNEKLLNTKNFEAIKKAENAHLKKSFLILNKRNSERLKDEGGYDNAQTMEILEFAQTQAIDRYKKDYLYLMSTIEKRAYSEEYIFLGWAQKNLEDVEELINIGIRGRQDDSGIYVSQTSQKSIDNRPDTFISAPEPLYKNNYIDINHKSYQSAFDKYLEKNSSQVKR